MKVIYTFYKVYIYRVYEWEYDLVTNDHIKVDVASLEDVVSDIAWCQNVLNYDTMAVGSRNGNVEIYHRDKSHGEWEKISTLKHKSIVCRVGWTQTGNILQV